MTRSGWLAAERILCVRLDSMGDVLMTTPAMRALKNGGGRRVTLLASSAGAAIARFLPEVDEAIEFTAPWMKPRGATREADRRIIAALKRRRFDAAVIFTVYSQSPLPAAYLCYLAGIPLRLAHCRENPYQVLTDWVAEPEPQLLLRHEVRRHLDLVAHIGCRATDQRLAFAVPRAARGTLAAALAEAGVDCDRPLVVVHPGASAPSRRYPAASYARAMDLFAARSDTTVVFTGVRDEVALVSGIREAMTQPSHSLAGRLSIAELGALIERAALLVSNNTGPVHIAAALGTPVVDLYALTNPQHTPWQVASEVLYADVPCRYCYKSVCPAGHHGCLTGVAPERVADAAARLLARGRGARGAVPDADASALPSANATALVN